MIFEYFLHTNGYGVTEKNRDLLKTIGWVLSNLFENDQFAPKD